MNINDIINYSGDSFLEDYSFKSGKAYITLYMEEIERKVLFTIGTNYMAFNVPEKNSLPYRTCFLEFINLSEVLDTKNGTFVPAENFGAFMKQKRQNLNLAYGVKEREYTHLLSVTSSSKLASFLIKSLEDINIQPLD